MNYRVLRIIVLTFFNLLFLTTPTFANTFPVEQIQVPNCLAANLPASYKILADNDLFKIVEVPSNEFNELSLLADKTRCGRFINLSSNFIKCSSLLSKKNKAKLLLESVAKKPNLKNNKLSNYAIKQENSVNQLLEQVDPNRISQTLAHLTSYYNRSSLSQKGAQVAEWLKAQIDTLSKNHHREDVSTYFVKTGWYPQPSLVTVIGKDLTKPGIVLGAHMDTLDGFMPGAGDDGSGSSSLMEVARILLSSDLTFNAPIYLIWYAAEERGLVGSQYVVENFMEKRIPVKSVIQFDMTGYRNDPKDPTMWVFKDYTDKALSNFVADLIKTYLKVPVKYSKCGYGCSDHASWNKMGIPAAFPCETSFEEHNPYIHTSSDTTDRLNTEHMANFAKLGLAFAVELASE